jgi:NitT/TauT family transport system substrate-binding protein
MDDAAAAMMGGDIAAGELWEPYASQVLGGLEGSKQATNSRDPKWLKTGLLADGVYFNADFIRDRRDVAMELLAALYKAVDFWKANPAEGNQIIADGLKFAVADVEQVIGKDGTGLDGGLYPYTFLEAARFCGAAPGDPPFEQANGGMFDHWKLVNDWWVRFELVKGEMPAENGMDCSLHKSLHEAGLQNELKFNQ